MRFMIGPLQPLHCVAWRQSLDPDMDQELFATQSKLTNLGDLCSLLVLGLLYRRLYSLLFWWVTSLCNQLDPMHTSWCMSSAHWVHLIWPMSRIFQQYSNDQCIPIFIAKRCIAWQNLMQFETNNNKEQHLAWVAIVPCGFRAENKELESKTVRKMALSFHFSCGQNRKSCSLVFLCSETKRKRLLCRRSTPSCHWSAVSLVKQAQTDLFVHAPAPFSWYSISWQPLGLV